MAERKALAFDYGASSGRAIIGTFDGNRIRLQEVHRFSNDPVIIGETMYWDTLRLFFEMKQGMLSAKQNGGFDSIGVDTWGVDFGLLDKYGNLIGNPVHYRDARNVGMSEKSFSMLGRDEFYGITGIQIMDINTAFQLLSIKEKQPEILDATECMLFTPDLLNYFLTGEKKAEYSIASTSQLLDARRRCWSDKVIDALGLPKRIFPEIIPSGTTLGSLRPSIREELSLDDAKVVAICGHDTQDAMVSVPTDERDFIFISCGTWSLFGTEIDEPIIDENSAMFNVTNEGGYQGRISFLKNIIGLWLIQESRRQWKREGKEFSFGELEEMAKAEPEFKCFIDPDAPEFVPSGNIPRRIRAYCERTGQPIPENEGQIVRCINESLAFKYRDSLIEIKSCTGKDYGTIYLVGGGAQSGLLCQMTANACGCNVSAGPVEATVYGNLSLQLMSTGELGSIEEARSVIKASEDVKLYESRDTDKWEEAYARYRRVAFGE